VLLEASVSRPVEVFRVKKARLGEIENVKGPHVPGADKEVEYESVGAGAVCVTAAK
jgi:hypothetical protein